MNMIDCTAEHTEITEILCFEIIKTPCSPRSLWLKLHKEMKETKEIIY